MNCIVNKNEVIKKTLELIDRTPEEWITFNDKLNTKILDESNLLELELVHDEYFLLECILENSFVVITTKRILSKYRDCRYEMNLSDFNGFSNEYEKKNHELINGKGPKTNIISVKNKHSDEKLLFEIDSFYPANFVKMLIMNLESYINNGKWFWKNKY
jgi:hypothetical protein